MEPIFHNAIFFMVLFFCCVGSVSLAFPLPSVLRRRKRKAKRSKGKIPRETGNQGQEFSHDVSQLEIRKERIRGGVTLAIWLVFLMFLRPSLGFRERSHLPSESDSPVRTLVSRESEKYMSEQPIVGMAVAVMNGEEEFVVGFGRRDLSTDLPPDGDTLFELASLTKLFTGTLLAKEIINGELAVTNPVAAHLPDGVSMPETLAKSLTFKHLVTHTSGLPNRGENLKSLGGLIPLITGRNPYRGYTSEAFWDDVRSVQPGSEPGEAFRYSNFGTSLVGAVLANKAAISYEDRVKELICAPLGMDDTIVVPSPNQESRRTLGHRSVISMGPLLLGFAAEPWLVPDLAAPEGGLLSTPNDMLKFLKANAQLDHPDLGPAMKLAHKQLYKWTDYYSLGINWFRSGFDGHTLLQHEGRSTGQRSFIGIIEGQPIGIVVLSNSQISVDDLGKLILRRILEMNKKSNGTDQGLPDP